MKKQYIVEKNKYSGKNIDSGENIDSGKIYSDSGTKLEIVKKYISTGKKYIHIM